MGAKTNHQSHNFQSNELTKIIMSDLKVFASPERYVQGRNATEQLGAEMKKLGMKEPIIVVSSGTPRRLLEATWTK